MPSKDIIEQYGAWYLSYLMDRDTDNPATFELFFPSQDLCESEIEPIMDNNKSHLWRFRPSALVVEKALPTPRFHVVLATSNAISLKDVGELNCYARIMDASSGCIISPKGISNEVRLVQAESSVRDRLFRPSLSSTLFLIQWSLSRGSVIPETVIPIEKTI